MSAVDAPAARTGGEPAAAPLGAGRRALLTPACILLIGLAVVAYTQTADLDSTEARSLNLPHIAVKTWEHIGLTAVSTVLVLAIAVPLGVLTSRRWMRWSTPGVLAVANIGQSAPPVGVIVLLAIAAGIGFWPAVAALVLYGMLPALRNTMVGLQQVDPALVEAARGIGMSAWRTLLRVELPLAVPVILAGVRTTLVHNVGVAGLAAFISGGGLGELVVSGVNTSRVATLVVGSLLIALLALLVDWIAGVVTAALRPKGLS
ncbi:ABC transporter permease [Marinactinospora rubrisoli]|uniref:ABC transporter permease n=1 Tax=Marinactinospora rubrisoli TaxID=2715399 RepID=A0ABW2KFV9_9ACTN